MVLLLLLLLKPVWAQTDPTGIEVPNPPIPNYFEHLSLNEGLSNNSVNCILQDQEGFMWFGTDDGLNKYDGYTFTTFRPDYSNPTHSLQNTQISGLCEDHANRLWVATEGGGLHEIDKRTGRVTPHPIRTRDAGHWNYQHSVYEDSGQVLWVSTLGGLVRYQPDRHHFTLFPLPQPGATLKTVFEDPQHRFWVATLHGLYLFNRTTGQYTPVPVPGLKGLPPTFISFYLDPQQTLWLGTATAGYSLFRLDLTHQPWQLKPYNPAGQLNPFVYLNSIHADSQGLVWVGTTNGLQGIDPLKNQVYTYHPSPDIPNGISSNNAQCVYHDRSGTIWVGTDNGIDRQLASTKPFLTYQVKPNRGLVNLPENRVVALMLDQQQQLWLSTGYTTFRTAAGKGLARDVSAALGAVNGHKNAVFGFLPDSTGQQVWIATTDGLYQYNQVSGQYTFYRSEVPAQYIDWSPTGQLWLGGDGGIASFDPPTHRFQYFKYDPNKATALPDQYVNGLVVSQSGEVWVPFLKQGIGRFNPKMGQFIRYRAGPQHRLNSNDILSIYEDNTGIIWLGTQQGGLNRFDPQTGLFSAITTREGLPGNTVMGITSDAGGDLWLSTNKGLCRLDLRTNKIHNYQYVSDLPGNSFQRNAVFRQKDQLLFGSLNGVVYFDPTQIQDDTRPFPVYITELRVMDRPRPLTDSPLTLNHDENFLSFAFAALTYAPPEQHQYTYQLVGVDQKWIQNGSRHLANYTNLPPGHYTFRVKAANADGFWTPMVATLALVIRPPWWQTWWAYSVYGLLAGMAIWGFIRAYTNRIRQEQLLELNQREAEQLKMVDELKTRFFANITHEFRTPLSLILSPVEKLLQQTEFDAPTRQTLRLVQRNANQLLRLINQLLDLSKLEANRMSVSLMRGDVSLFIDSVIESVRARAEQKEIRLTYTVDGSLPDQLFDADKWEKIVTNLLSNALKFTPAGGTVTVTLTPEPGAGSRVRLRVADSGIGIDPEHLPYIFDRFYQADTSQTRAYEGTGIGLALVNELVGVLGGTISVESEPAKGTTFELVLPLYPVSVQADAPRVAVPENRSRPGEVLERASEVWPISAETHTQVLPVVLVVDDNDELRDFLARELAPNYRVLQAADGEAGWQMTQAELPDVLISDVMMPHMDGYTLTRLVKNHPLTNHIAVILLTAKAAHQSRIDGLAEGADEYLAKPFHLDELHLRLRNLLNYRQHLRDHYRQQFAQPDLPSPIMGVDDAFLQRVYQLLEEHLSNPALDVDWLADQLAMSRKTLYRKSHSLVQLAPNELIRQYRLRKAADLLRAGHNASQTAFMVGFKTPSYFTLVFKEFYLKTPTEFATTQSDQT